MNINANNLNSFNPPTDIRMDVSRYLPVFSQSAAQFKPMHKLKRKSI